MHIKELEVDNFKSFAEKVTIPFLRGFTTVSGPNGSGKSNIIDSILFALGLSTSRTLRAEKISHLISTYTKRNEASVQVTFGADGDGEEEFTVGRRIKKSSQGYNSTYSINGRTCTLTDVHAKLEQYNITPNSYNVIMQGDVTSIINCSANERRKIIDEIAGVADFDRRIEQAQNELGIVESRVQNSLLIKTEVDSRLEQLAVEKEQALKYQTLRDEKAAYESQITAVKYFDTKRSLEKAHENILDANKKKKEQENTLKDLDIKLVDVKKQHAELSQLMKEKGEDEQLAVKKQIEELKGDIDRKNSAINFNEKNIHNNLKAIEGAKNGIEKAKGKIDEINEQISAKETEIANIAKKKLEQETELQRILQEVSGLTQSADVHIKKRNELKSALDKAKNDELQLEKEKIPLESQLENLKKEIDDANKAIEDLETFKANFSTEKDRLEVEHTELTKELEDYKMLQQSVLNEYDKCKNELNDLGHDLRIASQKVYSLQANKTAFEEANFGREIDAIMNAKLKGVHAPLAKLGQVDKEYSLAMEVAMGGRMRHIVVDDDEVARVGIEILKSSNAGRATFLPLNKLHRAPTKLKLPGDKGVIDFAINLVDFEDKYIDAFYLALGETLVVEDYHTAQKLIGRYRMVTVSGEVFEKSGSITGGAAKRSGLKFSQNQDDELEMFTKKFEDLERKIKATETKKTQLEEKLDNIRRDYSNVTTAVTQSKMELSNLIKNSETTEQNINDKKTVIKENEPKIATIEKHLDKLETNHVELNELILNLETEIQTIESQMSEEELNNLKELTESTENAIKGFEKQIAECNNEIDKLKNNITFNNDIIKTREDQITSQLSDNEKMEAEKVKFAAEIKEVEAKIAELDEQIRELSENLLEFQKQRDSINEELLKIETEKNILQNNIERVIEQVESFKARRRELEPELEAAKKALEDAGMEIAKLTPTEISIDEINSKIQRIQRKMDELGDVNMKAITAFDEVKTRQEELITRIETLSSERKQILERMNGYEQLKKETFLKTYDYISTNFQEIFTRLSDGEGSLILENPEDPFSGGLTIEARPRDKATRLRLEGLSGGEKTLTALAFVFAIQRYMPAPFYSFDEVDANLDGLNVEKLAEMIKAQAENTQFVVVSHRKPMIESANRTIGVTQKEKGKTSVTGVKLRD